MRDDTMHPTPEATRRNRQTPGTPEHVEAAWLKLMKLSDKMMAAREELEVAMVAMRQNGATLRQVGLLGGMSAQGVQKMLRRRGVE